MTEEMLTLKYRPSSLKEVIGQQSVTRSLKQVLAKGTNRSFLFTGPPGTGKTTLARVAAMMAGCEPSSLREVEAAKLTGVDDMRALLDGLSYKGFSKSKSRAFILDEVHRLSGNAFDALLKPLEEPPAHVWWFLCTTAPDKVPQSIRTRCTRYDLKPVPKAELSDWLSLIAAKEDMLFGMDESLGESIIDLCAKKAQGSPRQALVFLGAASGAKSIEDAKQLMSEAAESSLAIDLARALLKGLPWPAIKEMLAGMRNENAEGVRKVMIAYMNNVVLGKTKNPMKALAIMEKFSQPFYSDGIAPVTLACAQLLLGG